jgi:hypothetical protein
METNTPCVGTSPYIAAGKISIVESNTDHSEGVMEQIVWLSTGSAVAVPKQLNTAPWKFQTPSGGNSLGVKQAKRILKTH